jgi:uncharacterized protein
MGPTLKIRRSGLLWCSAVLVLAVSGIARADDIQKIHPTGYVTDLAGILDTQTKTQLEALGTELEQRTGAQLAVVTVKSLDGQDVETYANDLFKHLGVGQKKNDNGVMLLIAPNDRKYWTEVGYGLEPIINDARAGDTGRLMRSYFLQGNYNGGVSAAAWQLAKYIADSKGVTLSGASQTRPRPARDDGRHVLMVIVLVVVAFGIISALSGGSGGMNRGGGGGGFLTGLLLGALLNSGGRGGGWGGGGSGGGGWGGSGGGFGGFGGGSSGGGGAGGSW